MADKFLIYDLKADAQQAMSDVWEAYKTEMEAKGFPIINGEIVPKNAATGEPDYTAQRTIAWAIPTETIDNKYFIPEPPPEIKSAITIAPTVETDIKPEILEIGTPPEEII